MVIIIFRVDVRTGNSGFASIHEGDNGLCHTEVVNSGVVPADFKSGFAVAIIDSIENFIVRQICVSIVTANNPVGCVRKEISVFVWVNGLLLSPSLMQ